MRSWTIAFSSGILLAGYIPALPLLSWVIAVTLLGVAMQWLSALRIIGALLLGACWLCLWALWADTQIWPHAESAETLWVQGRVQSLPSPTERGQRFVFRITAVCAERHADPCDRYQPITPRKVQLSLYEALAIEPGDRWQLRARLHRPHGFANPGNFDYEAWQWQQGLRASGYVRVGTATRTGRDIWPLFNKLRYSLGQKLNAVNAETLQFPELLKALTLGDRTGISDAQWALFAATGTNHLMVISGLHVGLIAALLYQVGLRLAPLLLPASALLFITAPRAGAVSAILAAFCYCGLAGFSLPAIRAFIMICTLMMGLVLQRQTKAINSWTLALFIVLLMDPLAPQSAGFWLSFLAVAILLYPAGNMHQNGWQKILGIVTKQLLLTLGMLPVMLLFFQQTSLLAPLVNLLAIPFVGLVLVPLALTGVALVSINVTLASVLLGFCDTLLFYYLHTLQWLVTTFSTPILQLPGLSGVAMFLLVSSTALFFLSKRPWLKTGAVALVPLILLWPSPQLEEGEILIQVLDVGQGLAVLISTRHYHLLYDTGDRFSANFSAGNDVILPLLAKANIASLDTIIVSHADSDHAGGLPALEQTFPGATYLGSDTRIFSQNQGQRCQPSHWSFDGIEFAFLHPVDDTYLLHNSRNNGSCVLLVRNQSHSVLLPGDIEKAAEQRLLLNYPELQADILVSPHHGSKTSSSASFLARLNPKVVIHSSGYLNRFKHPAQTIVGRYRDAGIQQFNTAYSGAVTILLKPDTSAPLITEERKAHPRFWRTLPLWPAEP